MVLQVYLSSSSENVQGPYDRWLVTGVCRVQKAAGLLRFIKGFDTMAPYWSFSTLLL